MAETIDTAQVAERRKLRFASLEDLRAELDRIAAADREGRLRTLGNWTAGQNLAHISAWINYAFDGFPVKSAPLFVRMVMKLMKNRYLRNGFPAGVHIPKVEGGTTGQDMISTQEGVSRLRKAIDRMESGEVATHPSPAFGSLTREEGIQVTLRHAELHLGFLKY